MADNKMISPKLVTDYLSGIMKDVDGNPSSKRYATLICLIAVLVAFFANLFGGFKMDQFIFDGVRDLAIAGLGFTGLEKFTKKVVKTDGTSDPS
jgi:hypothetical protein